MLYRGIGAARRDLSSRYHLPGWWSLVSLEVSGGFGLSRFCGDTTSSLLASVWRVSALQLPVRTTRHVLKTPEEYARDTGTAVPQLKKYFKHSNIPDIIQSYPLPGATHRRGAGGGNTVDTAQEKEARRVFTHFVLGLLNPNPWKRWTPKQVCSGRRKGSLNKKRCYVTLLFRLMKSVTRASHLSFKCINMIIGSTGWGERVEGILSLCGWMGRWELLRSVQLRAGNLSPNG